MTWGEMQIICLQKMFAITGNELIKDDTTLPYIKSMPAVANEALTILATAGRYIRKKGEIIISDGNSGTTASEEVTGYNKYNLSEFFSDFYSLDENQVMFDDGKSYGKSFDFDIENGDVFVVRNDKYGTFSFYYNAYPERITSETTEDEELSLYDEVADLIPLYMASQLYKDDDISQAVQMRNEFDAGREMLIANNRKLRGSTDKFYSKTGWY